MLARVRLPLLVALGAVACWSQTPAPVVLSFTAVPSRIMPGEVATLFFSTQNATSITISGIGPVALNGPVIVAPLSTTVYTLTAVGPGGRATAFVTVAVPPAVPAPGITVSTPFLNFYDVATGATRTQSITITPSQPLDVVLSVIPLPGTTAKVFSVEGDLSFRIQQERTLTIQFSPTQAGAFSAMLQVTAPNAAISTVVSLSGGGVTESSIGVTGIGDAADGSGSAASDRWLSIFGENLSKVTRAWDNSDFKQGKWPTELSGVSVEINSKRAYISFISDRQINILSPLDVMNSAEIQAVVTTADGKSNPFPIPWTAFEPKLLTIDGDHRYVAATFVDGTLIGKAGLLGPDIPTRAVLPGDSIAVYLDGLGPAIPSLAPGRQHPLGLLNQNLSFSISGQETNASYVALIGPGLYQAGFQVPNLAPGDAIVSFVLGGRVWAGDVLLTIGPP